MALVTSISSTSDAPCITGVATLGLTRLESESWDDNEEIAYAEISGVPWHLVFVILPQPFGHIPKQPPPAVCNTIPTVCVAGAVNCRSSNNLQLGRNSGVNHTTLIPTLSPWPRLPFHQVSREVEVRCRWTRPPTESTAKYSTGRAAWSTVLCCAVLYSIVGWSCHIKSTRRKWRFTFI